MIWNLDLGKKIVLKFGPSLPLLLVNFGHLGRAKFWLANPIRKISGKMKLVSRGTLHNKKGSLDQNKQLLCHGEGPKNGVACYDIMAGKIRETFWNTGASGKTIWSLDLAEKFAFQLLRFSTTLPTLKNGVATHKNGVA